MLRPLVLVLMLGACGGSSVAENTIGTIGPVTDTRAIATTTTVPPEPHALEGLVISINRMPDGWVEVDDMSGTVGIDALDPSLIEGVDDVGIVNGYRVTFARSGTSEVGALARAGAELVVSLAFEMVDGAAAEAAIVTIESAVEPMTVTVRQIRTPGGGNLTVEGINAGYEAWSGAIDQSDVTFGGLRAELADSGGGSTEATFAIAATSRFRMNGEETWSWTDGTTSCEAVSDLTLRKR